MDVLLGVRYPCESMSGRLTLRRGVPEGAEDAGEMDAADVLAEQKAMSTCPESTAALEGGACANGDCLQWQEFVLDTPVRLVKGEVYSFVLEGFYSADMTRTARVGVSPHSENNGGRSSLLVSPVYKVCGEGRQANERHSAAGYSKQCGADKTKMLIVSFPLPPSR